MPSAVATDTSGNVYFVASFCVFKLDTSGTITRIAGNARPGYSGDGGPAINAQIFAGISNGLTVDAQGNVYFSDDGRVRRISPSGTITTVAGNSAGIYSGEGGPAVNARLSQPFGLATDGRGNLYIADSSRVLKVAPNGIITTIAGTGKSNSSGDGGPATSAQFTDTTGLAIDPHGNLFVAEFGVGRIRKISPDGIITTFAGGGSSNSGDGGTATDVRLSQAMGLAVDHEGNLLIAELRRIRKVSPNGIITTVAGTGVDNISGDGTAPVVAGPRSIAIDPQGNIFFQDALQQIRKVSPDRVMRTVAGGGAPGAAAGGPASSAQMSFPGGITADVQGNLFIADQFASRVWKVSPDGMISAAAGNGTPGYSGDGGPATEARLRSPGSVAVDAQGNLLICDTSNYRIRKVSASGIITTTAGTGTRGHSGDGGPATSANLIAPESIIIDRQGNIFFVEEGGFYIRKISPDGIIITVAGTGAKGYSGDGGLATSAPLAYVISLATDGQGNLYLAEQDNQRVRKISAAGIITTVVGTGTAGYSGDGGPATKAQVFNPTGLVVGSDGSLYITESQRIRKVTPGGMISTVVGACSAQGYSGDGGPANTAQFVQIGTMTMDAQGSLYVIDVIGMAVRRLQPTTRSVLLSAVADAASQSSGSLSPGKIVVFYGAGLGPSALVQNQPASGVYSTQIAGSTVSVNGVPAPIIYTSATQVAAIVPYATSGSSVQISVTYAGETSLPMAVPFATTAPSLFTLNQTGGGQAAAVNAVDGSINTAANPVKAGEYISLFATGEGQTTPAGADGKIASATAMPQPTVQVTATVGGFPAVVQYAGAAPGSVAGLMQVNVQIPTSVQSGGFVPVVLRVGNAATLADAVWISVADRAN
jgi:uncharacterized protein (TIGR03437 family)